VTATDLVCLLADGASVEPRSLALLAEFLDTHPDAGAVAPVAVRPDGGVCEAGGVLGGDGWYRSYPDDDGFPREVDHPGSTCLLVRGTAWAEVGATEPDHADLAELSLALRARGWQVWLQPAARAVRAGAPAEPRQLARPARWAAELAGRAPLAGIDEHPHRLWWLRDHVAPYRVLLIDDRVPQADRGRGDPHTLAVVDAWRDADPRARVTYFAASADRAREYAPALRARGVEVVWGVDAERWSCERAGLYDVLVVFRPHNFVALGQPMALAQPQAVRVYDGEALFHRRPEQLMTAATDPEDRERFAREAAELRAQEVRAVNWADVAVCVSEEEAAWVRAVAADTRVHVACYRAAVPEVVPGWEQRAGLVFFGGFDATPRTPNELAVLELATELLPALRRRHPGLTLRIVGADPSPAVCDLAAAHVRVLGRVPDPVPLLGSALLHVAPMRIGAGVKIKFVDSMAAGLPFVTTPLGAEGLHLGALARHLVGESAAELLELCHALLTDRPLWTDVQRSLVAGCREHFSAERFAAAMRDVLADCGVAGELPPRGCQAAAQ
jgi:glycosyltransferase involved in cell wall biosynthesis